MDEVINLLEKALQILREKESEPESVRSETSTLAGGSKVSPVFRDRVRRIDETLGVNPDYLEAQKSGAPTHKESASQSEPTPLAWGAKVSPVFRDRVRWIGETLGVNPDYLMACMAWETGEKFTADVKNMAGSGATGLIQFMPSTAVSLGTSTKKLAAMTPEDQLNFVYKYFRPYHGRLRNLGDVYMAILWPKAVGQSDAYVLWDKGKSPTTFRQNAGLDTNKDGKVTRAECLRKIEEKLAKGLLPKNRG